MTHDPENRPFCRSTDDVLMPLAAIARYVGKSRYTVSNAHLDGRLEWSVFGGARHSRKCEVDAWIANEAKKPISRTGPTKAA